MIWPEHSLPGSYDPRLVVLSVLIAVTASYAALDLAGRVASARGSVRAVWLGGGAIAMGLGIWSMHYVGMLAFRLPVPIEYDWPTVLLSLLAAILASAIALFVASREEMGLFRAAIGSIFMGSAIAGMHYIGMAAMRLPAICHYSRGLVSISVVLAIIISYVALLLTFRFRGETKSGGWRKALSAVVMGAAIPVMHYTGMAGASFSAATATYGGLSHALNISSVGTVSIIAVTFMVLGLTVLTSLVDRRFSAQASELKAREKRYRQIIGTALDAFIGMDAKGHIVEWNQQAEITFGWASGEALGKRLSELIIPRGYRAAHESGLHHFVASDESPVLNRRIELMALHRDGREFPIELAVSALELQQSHLFTAFVRDITERKRSDQELLEAKEAAETANEAKSSFLANMSHEIRTPMNGILGMTELVLDTELTAEQRENLELVKLSADSLLSIINDILDFSKIEAGKLELESIPFDLRESLGETMKSLSFRAHQKGLELIHEVEPDVPEGLLGDPGRIRQVLINLTGNAIKFTAKGEIFIEVKEDCHENGKTCLHFSVKDTGIGIPPEKQKGIFEAFSQADGSMARRYGGTGLGLAICTKLVAMMMGRIWVESQVERGSTFHFTAWMDMQEESSRAAAPLPPEQLRDVAVLVVDDNSTNRRVVCGMLSRWGMKPTAVDSGPAALEALREATSAGHLYKLILLDGQMPEMDGFTLAGLLVKDPSLTDPAIMMLTSAGRVGDAARCRELGISSYLMKPIRHKELLDAISNVLRAGPPTNAALVTRHTLREERTRSRVLLAEDNAVNQTLAVRLLKKRGYHVSVASNGREAVEAFEREKFDVVLMDIQMPEMDGFEATAAIREKEKRSDTHIPIIAMTANALKGDEERCLQAGMDGYVSKPIQTKELIATIERLVDRWGSSGQMGTLENQSQLS